MADKLVYANTHLNRGNFYFDKSEYDRAISSYSKALYLKPDLIEALINRYRARIIQKEYDQAITDSDLLIQYNPDLALAYYNKGRAYSLKENHEQAIFNYNKAIELRTDYVEALLNRGSEYLINNDYDNAVLDFCKAKDFDLDYANNYIIKGNRCFLKEELDIIISNYSKAIELQTNDAKEYLKRGNIYRIKGDFDQAIADYIKAIELKKDFIEAILNLGNTYLEKIDINQAIIVFSNIINIKPDCADAYFYRGNCHYKNAGKKTAETITEYDYQQEELKLALLDYDEALLLNQYYVSAWNNRGRVYIEEGINVYVENAPWTWNPIHIRNRDEAIKSFNIVLNYAPDFINAYISLYYYTGNNIEYVIKALRIDPENAIARKAKNRWHIDKGEPELAVSDLTKIINENPNNAESWRNRAREWKSLRKRELAAVDYIEAVKLDSGFITEYVTFIADKYDVLTNIINWLSNVVRNDDLKIAEQYLLETLNYYPENSELYKALGDLYQKMEYFDKSQDAYDKAIHYFNKANLNTPIEDGQNG